MEQIIHKLIVAQLVKNFPASGLQSEILTRDLPNTKQER
jgi:hypothetical protein